MNSLKSRERFLRSGEHLDEFLGGRLKVIQSLQGYRFSIDAVLLAQFIATKKSDIIIELGTGCGVILLMLLITKSAKYALGVEIQEELASQASRNARLNQLQACLDVTIGDIKELPLKKGCADLVICNPPYRRARSGRVNPDPRKAIARHEILVALDDVLRAALYLLKKRGRIAVIYPAFRLVEITTRMKSLRLEPKRIRIVYPDLASSAKLALVEAVPEGKPGVDIQPPVIGQGDAWIDGPP
jgi:tRNA1(Val) A37 N6-methylase TrmN6